MKPFSSLPPSSSHDNDVNSQSFLHNSRNGRKNSTRSGCITTILRRILCISSLPSSPFDNQIKEDEQENSSLLEGASSSATTTPSVVARLMGLESGPRIAQARPSVSSIDPFKKSRSSSSPKMRYKKIIPTYQELEDENFFILSFDHDKGDESVEITIKPRKSRGENSGRKKQRRKKSSRRSEGLLEWNKENIIQEVNCMEELDSNKEINFVHGNSSDNNVLVPLENSHQKLHSPQKSRKKVVKLQDSFSVLKLESVEAGSENSSPNSVLDFVEFPPDHAETASSGDISRLANTKMRRTLSEILENFRKPEEKRLIKDGCKEEEEEEKHTIIRLRNRKHYKNNYLGEIGEMAAKDMMKMSWLNDELSKNGLHFKEIGRDLASEILDQLLVDLIISLRSNFK